MISTIICCNIETVLMKWYLFESIRQSGFINFSDIPSPAVHAPSDDQIQRLVEMGFNRDSVLNALRVTNNDITMATNILLHES